MWRNIRPVTEADRSAEVALHAAISATDPDHAIPGEEYGETGSGSCRWVLDPVDGTRSFICGIPVWSTLIDFTVEGRARMGMMSQPSPANASGPHRMVHGESAPESATLFEAEHRTGRNYLWHRRGDAANAVVAAVGYNFRIARPSKATI
jgi:3'-phosphoadenosine 5'-phosphosulfate (PAPS) 3'-phosphatase